MITAIGASRARRPGMAWSAGWACMWLAGRCLSAQPVTTVADGDALAHTVAVLQARLTALKDIQDIKRLQRAYGYYLDVGQWDQVAQLFSRNATLEIGLDGVYQGQEHIRQYFLA